jgi:RNA polymerase sigma-70 factor (ECF subfamily)
MDVVNDSGSPHELVSADRSFVFAVVRRILRDEDAAADATQDALLLAHRHRGQFRGDAAHRTWLYRIAVTTALGHLRKQRRRREDVAPDEPAIGWDAVDPGPSPEQEVAVGELAGAMSRALAAVADGHREVFLLRLGDWSETEIASHTGLSVANVKIRAYRTRAVLREALREHAAPHREHRPPRAPSSAHSSRPPRRARHAAPSAASASRTPG